MPDSVRDLAFRVEKRFCTPTEAARILGISRSQIYEMMISGEIPFENFGGVRRISVLFIGMVLSRAEERAARAAEKLSHHPPDCSD